MNHGPGGLRRIAAALVIVALAFRTQVLVIGPMVGELQVDLGMSHAVAGLLGTIPVLCMAILAPLGPVLAGSIGPRLGVAACVALIGVFGVARSVMPDAPTVLLATVGIGVGMGVVGPILPMIVRARLPSHPAAGTGAYVAGLIIGGSAAAAVVVPLADGLGGWRPAFAAISAAAAVSFVAWLLLVPTDAESRTRPALPRLPWRSRPAWLFGLAFGTQSTLFYGAITWLASAYIERGWTTVQAAGLIAFFNAIGLVASLSVPAFADRIGTRRSQMTTAALAAILGAIGIVLTPGEPSGSALALGAVALLGIGIGAFFPLALTLPVDLARSPSEAASISALMLLVGYLLSSIAPVFLGLVRDATGNFDLVLWLLVGLAVAMLPLALAMSPARLRRPAAT